jgi:hypothetical protein
MPRASAPPKADAQSSGKTLNKPNKNAAPQATSRSATLGVLAENSGAGRPCARDQLRNSGGNSFSAPEAEQVAMSTATRGLGPIPDAITKPQLPQR